MWSHHKSLQCLRHSSVAQCMIQYKLSTAVMWWVLFAWRLLWGGGPPSLDLVQYRRRDSSTVTVCILG